jgi:hypothetical protein
VKIKLKSPYTTREGKEHQKGDSLESPTDISDQEGYDLVNSDRAEWQDENPEGGGGGGGKAPGSSSGGGGSGASGAGASPSGGGFGSGSSGGSHTKQK